MRFLRAENGTRRRGFVSFARTTTRMRFLVTFILGAAILTTTLTNNGVSCSDDIVQKEDGGDIVLPKVHISRHFTTSDSKTGFPFALDPAVNGALEKMLITTSSTFSDDEDRDEEKAEVKEAFTTTKENPKYKGYYCPFVGHAKCEETDSPEKYHGVDAWTIDETFEGVSPPEHVPLGEFDQTRKVPSPWRALGVRERRREGFEGGVEAEEERRRRRRE